ncbi:MAG TPA: CRTAC1 family protein [Acidobacteriaceae bacterium]|nr:CRTAC1 family protein [Acidobacteriaceae bacterium]
MRFASLPSLSAQDPDYPFEEVPASASGITWVHTAGKSPEKYLPESSGAGCAFLDYDNDGWMDIYLVNSGKCDFYNPSPPLRNALYRNNRDGTFTDVTEKAGVAGGGYGQGVAVGDYNDDGFPDLYVTQYGRSILYRNNGDGTFTDVTHAAGVAAPGWASSAVWFDFDNDGRLDLFVGQFVEFSKTKNLPCVTYNNRPGYCIPSLYKSTASWLFRNNGDGTFTDVSKSSGIAEHPGKAWGVVAADLNNDGRIDLFVSNDTTANFLFMNRGAGRFEEIGALAGVAFSEAGKARSGMGVDAADVNQDGWLDLFVANIDHEEYSLYENNHNETFDDEAGAMGIAGATRLMSGWGLKFFDYDNDGNLDLFIANGNPDDLIQTIRQDVTYREPLLLFHGGGKTLRDVSASSGPIFSRHISARGLAIGDFDNDGAVDVLIAVNDGAPLLLRNRAARGRHWLGLRLVGTESNRDAIGARVTWQAGDMKRSRTKVGGGSYLSSHDPRLVLGLGDRLRVDWLEVQWPQPAGKKERFTELPIDRYITIIQGKGIV